MLLKRLRKIACALTQFVEQPRILDSDDGLSSEVLNQLDLLVGEWAHLLAVDENGADQLVVLKHGHCKTDPRAAMHRGRTGDRIRTVVVDHISCQQEAIERGSSCRHKRTTLAKEFPNGLPNKTPAPSEPDRNLLERYVQAWEGADLDSLIALLKRDAVLAMPPFQQWYRGPENIRMVLARAWGGPLAPPFRLIATSANQQPAFGLYSFNRQTSEFEAVAIDLIELQGDSIARIDAFIDASLFPCFGLPLVLPAWGSPSAAQ